MTKEGENSIIENMIIGFNEEKYIKLQSEKILERARKFKKLYLEFGGKLFGDYNAARAIPGFGPDTKVKMLMSIKEKCEVIICIDAGDIGVGKIQSNSGLIYENEVLRLKGKFEEAEIKVAGVAINRFDNQQAALAYKRRLENLNVPVFVFNKIEGYPDNIDNVVSDKGYGSHPYIETTKPIIIVTSPGAKSGKMGVSLSLLYNEIKRGNKSAGYAKFETLPVWNLPLKHPLNIEYEAATLNVADKNMIDPFHLEKYNVVAVSYNRDIEAFPLLKQIFHKMYGNGAIYHSPTEMGVNMIGDCIENDEVVSRASKEEILRRYYEALVDAKTGKLTNVGVNKINYLMSQAGVGKEDRKVAELAKEQQFDRGTHAAAMILKDGTELNSGENGYLTASSALLLKALQHKLGVKKEVRLLNPKIIEEVSKLKTDILKDKEFMLTLSETLIILTNSAGGSGYLSKKAIGHLIDLQGAEAHITYIITPEEKKIWQKLGVNVTMCATIK